MKIKITVVCLAVVIAIMAVAGATLSYLQDTDYDRNVMAVGNVSIVQNEQERDEDGNLKDFDGGDTLIPATKDPEYSDVTFGNYGVFRAFGEEFNPIDKIITVENTGSEAAYVRTLVALEHNDPNGDGDYTDGISHKMHLAFNSTDWTVERFSGALDSISIGDGVYSLVVFTYKKSLAADGITAPSLLQVFLDKSADNDDLAAEELKDGYDILVLSQAVQAAGWDDQDGEIDIADYALDAAFAPITDDNAETVAAWFEDAQ